MFKDRSYVIFGGSSGIGLATAFALHEKGAALIIIGRSKEKLELVLKQLQSRPRCLSLDIADERAVASFFSDAPMLDGIICTAGETPPGSIESLEIDAAKLGFESKFWGQYYIVKYGRAKLKASGSIILSSGVFSARPVANVGVLAAVNGAIQSFVRAMAVEIAPIRINAIAPGLIETPRLKKVSGRDPQAFAQRLEREVPLKRVGYADEVASSMLYLLSNTYTTGSTLYVDGGITLL